MAEGSWEGWQEGCMLLARWKGLPEHVGEAEDRYGQYLNQFILSSITQLCSEENRHQEQSFLFTFIISTINSKQSVCFNSCSNIAAANTVVHSSIKAKSNIYKLDRKEEAPRRKQNWIFRMAALFQTVSLYESGLCVSLCGRTQDMNQH